jgi:filamin
MGDEPTSENKTWVDVQKKTFTRWANQFLAERMLKMNDMQEDLKDGVMICELLEVISSKKVGSFTKKPKTRYQFLENNGRAINFIKNEGLKLVGIGPEDLVDGKLKLDLGLMWTIILRYHINVIGQGSPKWELLQWVRQQIEPYSLNKKGDNLKNFTTDWQDGTVLFALTDSLQPGILTPENMSKLTKRPLQDTQKAMDTAEDAYGIPKLLDADDLVNNPEELSVMTYISYFRDYLSDEARRRREEAERRRKTAHPALCYAFGPGIEGGRAGSDNEFTIQSVNCNGDNLTVGGCQFDVGVTGPKPGKKPNVRDNNDGTYSVVYQVAKGGDYEVGIRLTGQKGIDQLPQGHPGWGQHIKDSPYHVNIIGADASSSYATGPGVEGPARTNKDNPFTIHSMTSEGKPVPAGGENFKATVRGPENVNNVPIKDKNDGTYDGAYKVKTPGHYEVDISLDGVPIQGSPYRLLIENANAGNSWAEGPGLEGGQQGKEGVFTIHSVDADGKPVKTGGDPFKVQIHGPNGDVAPRVKDNNDGTYTVKYNPDAPGDYNIDVNLHDEPIKDAPFNVHIKPSPNAGNSWAEGPGLEEAWDNEPAFFTIHSVDNDGNPREEGGDPFTVKIQGPKPCTADVKDNGDGTYSVTYEPDVPGDYTIRVELDNKPIKDSPFRVGVKAGTDIDNSGFGIFSFTVQARDKRGQPKDFGGDKFEVKIKGPSGSDVEVQTMDNNDGTYTAIYALAGDDVKGKTFNINAQLNGKTVGQFKQNM